MSVAERSKATLSKSVVWAEGSNPSWHAIKNKMNSTRKGEIYKCHTTTNSESYRAGKTYICNVDNTLTDADILDYIPKTYQNKSKLLLKHMKLTGMSWDSFGRLLLGDECLLDSHIVDLVRDIVVQYKKGCKSKHSHALRSLLHATHCPRYLLSNPHNDDKKINKG